MGRSQSSGDPLGFLAILVILAIIMAAVFSASDASCEDSCRGQYGNGWTSRNTYTKYDSICDCISPDGVIKAPR